jgi:riboflavin transporter FmnP|tara:strand:+ start:1543 stop:2142 length:600 start_codon:yes stop_codon:yes gene_type:complete
MEKTFKYTNIRSKTRIISTSVIFSALAIVLHPPFFPVAIPAPYAPFLIYSLWEIPLIIAFIVFGPLIGIISAFMNSIVLYVFFPGSLPVGPFYNLIAIYGMMIGILISYRISQNNSRFSLELKALLAAVVTRTAIMYFVNYVVLPMDFPLGFSVPSEEVSGLLYLISIFNITTTLYTIPIAFMVSKAVSDRLDIRIWNR